MVERLSSRDVLRLAAMCVALLGLGLGAACDNNVRAQATYPGASPEADDATRIEEQMPTGGGPIDRGIERQNEGFIDQPADQAPAAAPGVAEPPRLDQQGQQGPFDEHNRSAHPNKEDGAAGPEGDGSSEEEAPDDEHWRVPVRGSGGNNPPDFIAPSEPKAV